MLLLKISKSPCNSHSDLCCSLFLNLGPFHHITLQVEGRFLPIVCSKPSSYWPTSLKTWWLYSFLQHFGTFAHTYSRPDLCWFHRKLWIISAEPFFKDTMEPPKCIQPASLSPILFLNYTCGTTSLLTQLRDFWLPFNMGITGLSLRKHKEDKHDQYVPWCGEFPFIGQTFWTCWTISSA